MGKDDTLSGCADHGSGVADNHDITLLCHELFTVHALEGMTFDGPEHDIV
jgi:hypothetical protein